MVRVREKERDYDEREKERRVREEREVGCPEMLDKMPQRRRLAEASRERIKRKRYNKRERKQMERTKGQLRRESQVLSHTYT
ncbi:hypothetical protein H6P81_017562 [Aristolochia fimbriata]|uniref:Uncharacterized protein n=1 Tax=Aristolochia fimbriata TaxID=158543 RepID=A0AAV7E2U0_ARIFI|nr:hypothetical protein H6P81_017562 [Aristolochia fimbriata]